MNPYKWHNFNHISSLTLFCVLRGNCSPRLRSSQSSNICIYLKHRWYLQALLIYVYIFQISSFLELIHIFVLITMDLGIIKQVYPHHVFEVLVSRQESERSCVYQDRKVSGHVCIKTGKWAVMCVKGIDFVSFYDFAIEFWNCSDIVVFILSL
jgi:hypothetical protein